MKRIATLTALAMAGTLAAGSASALADGAGFNPQTKKLEAGFTVALTERVSSSNGCYPAPSRLAKVIGKKVKVRTGVTRRVTSGRRPGVVYVVTSGTSCNGITLALRYKDVVYKLDSLAGEIVVVGRKASREDVIIGNRGPTRAVRIVTRNYRLTVPDRRERLEAFCPGRTYPLGGGIITSPALAPDGEGVYPHSFERLGAQRGWHISGWLFDPTEPKKAARTVTVQAVCGLGLVPESAPHTTVFVKPGQVKTAVARCPGGQKLMSGGYQRTDFLSDGGNYITESRAIGSNQWRVSASAHGRYGGELTAIAYCIKSKRPLLTEVTASSDLPFGGSTEVTTPACPGGRRLTSGGFSAGGSSLAYFAGGWINGNGTWSIAGHGFFGAAPGFTAYGYCLQAR